MAHGKTRGRNYFFFNLKWSTGKNLTEDWLFGTLNHWKPHKQRPNRFQFRETQLTLHRVLNPDEFGQMIISICLWEVRTVMSDFSSDWSGIHTLLSQCVIDVWVCLPIRAVIVISIDWHWCTVILLWKRCFLHVGFGCFVKCVSINFNIYSLSLSLSLVSLYVLLPSCNHK